MRPYYFSVRKHLESYGSFFIDKDGLEVKEPIPMTWNEAEAIAKEKGGYIWTN